jgi:hypothetical protein
MQEFGSPLSQLLAFGLLAMTFALSWFVDKKYRANTSPPFIFPDASDNYQEVLESRRRRAKVYVLLWWAGAFLEMFLIYLAGYLMLSLSGGLAFLTVFGLFKVAAGILLFLKTDVDTLGRFEHLLESEMTLIPVTEQRLKRDIDGCIKNGLLRQEDYELLLQYLGRRSDSIGTVAREMIGGSIDLQ